LSDESSTAGDDVTGIIDLLYLEQLQLIAFGLGNGAIDCDHERYVMARRVGKDLATDECSVPRTGLLCRIPAIDNDLDVPPGTGKVGLHLEFVPADKCRGTSGEENVRGGHVLGGPCEKRGVRLERAVREQVRCGDRSGKQDYGDCHYQVKTGAHGSQQKRLTPREKDMSARPETIQTFSSIRS
jgi:hypothetical protein